MKDSDQYIKEDLEEIEKEVQSEVQISSEQRAKKEKKENTKLFFTASVILIIFIIFIVAIRTNKTYEPEYPSYNYNGFDFVKIGGLWHTDWQRDNTIYKLHLRFGPEDVEHIEIISSGEENFNIKDNVFLTFDPGGDRMGYVALGVTELTLSLYRTFNINVTAACTKNETDACMTRPIKNCINTNETVIYIKESDVPSAEFDNNCLIISGKDEELIKAIEKVVYRFYGIIS